MSWAWPGSGGVFCKTVSWDAAQSALCSRASLWCEVARTYQNGCPACCPRAHRPSRSHPQGHLVDHLRCARGDPRGSLAICVPQEVEDDFGVHRVDPWSACAVM